MSPFRLLFFVFAFLILVAIVQLNVITVAFDRLGLSNQSAYLLIMATLVGSLINLPLMTLRADDTLASKSPFTNLSKRMMGTLPFNGKTEIKVNVGGALLPVTFSIYLMVHHALPVEQVLMAILVVTGVSFWISKPVPGVGMGMPIFIAPICAAIVSSMLNPSEKAALAYISGTLGVLIGADLIHLKDIRHMGAPAASIGGAGSFDGIFITGFVAVLLA